MESGDVAMDATRAIEAERAMIARLQKTIDALNDAVSISRPCCWAHGKSGNQIPGSHIGFSAGFNRAWRSLSISTCLATQVRHAARQSAKVEPLAMW